MPRSSSGLGCKPVTLETDKARNAGSNPARGASKVSVKVSN